MAEIDDLVVLLTRFANPIKGVSFHGYSRRESGFFGNLNQQRVT
jgi:hypothetical protein